MTTRSWGHQFLDRFPQVATVEVGVLTGDLGGLVAGEALDALLSDGTVEQIFQQYGVTYIAP